MGEAERGESAPRQRISFWCANDHETKPSFASDAAIPETWDCPRCGYPAGRDQTEQQPTAERVSVPERGGDCRHRHETHTPGDVDDVVTPDPTAHHERDPIGQDEDRQCRTGDDEESHAPAPVGANVHW